MADGHPFGTRTGGGEGQVELVLDMAHHTLPVSVCVCVLFIKEGGCGCHVDVSRGWDRLIPGYVMDPSHKIEGKSQKTDEAMCPVPRYQVHPL